MCVSTGDASRGGSGTVGHGDPGRYQMNDPFMGEIRLFPYSFAPRGWAACDGALLPINQWQALFSLLGTTFGGDGQTTFGLPDLRKSAPSMAQGGYFIATEGAYPERN